MSLVSENFEGEVRFRLEAPDPTDGWGRYAVAAARVLGERLLRCPSRFRYHRVLPLEEGTHPSTSAYRFNLTFHKMT